jgi:hypothetical protein
MPRTYPSIDKIRAELAWVNETPDPNKLNKCGCRNLKSSVSRGNRTQAWSLLRRCRHEVLDIPVGVLLSAVP